MKNDILSFVVCPLCKGPLSLSDETFKGKFIYTGFLECKHCGESYPIVKYIPRFVKLNNYADSFGKQWNDYKRVQLDKFSKTQISKDRFYSITEWSPEELTSKKVLDIGCGAGRFSQIALDTGATVVAFDLSSSVDACLGNLREYENLHVVQADIFNMPFKKGMFDYVFSIGVLQHTPDPLLALETILKDSAKGTKLAFWIYGRTFKSVFRGKHILRPILKHLPIARLETTVKTMVDLCAPMAKFFLKIPFLGRIALRGFPIACAHLQGLPIKDEDLKNWIMLDTFDMYSPKYDKPQRSKRVLDILKNNCSEVKRSSVPGIGVVATK